MSLPSGRSAAWYQPEMLSRALAGAYTSCTEWNDRPGSTVKNAMRFGRGRSDCTHHHACDIR